MDPEGAAGRQAASPLPARRRQPRPLPVRDLAYAHLSLPALRGYRTALGTEESRVSYWRRILQARLDVVRAGAQGSLDSAHLRPVLTDARVGSGRRALVEVLDQGDIPPLPRLSELWDRRVAPDDAAGQRLLEGDLRDAEQQLSAYRAALHRRIDATTGELIARYRDQPDLCLTALPLPPVRHRLPA
jgi:hypothetical protein